MNLRRFFPLTVLLVLLLGAPAGAGQGNSVLEALFAALRTVPDSATADATEERIWDQWLWHPDPAVQAAMRAGVIGFNADNYDAAFDRFNHVVALDPTFAEGWSRRASAYYMLGDHTAAVRDLGRALALEPRHFGALVTLGLIYAAQNQPQPALRAFEAALALNPHLDRVREQVRALREGLAGPHRHGTI